MRRRTAVASVPIGTLAAFAAWGALTAVAAPATILAFATIVTPHAAAAAGQTIVGRWAISQPRATSNGSRVQLELAFDTTSQSSRGGFDQERWSDSMVLGELGISDQRLRAPIGPIAVRLSREPGTFDCTGTAGEGSGAGQFVYAPSPAFADALASRGIERPSPVQSVELAMDGMTIAFVDTYVRPGHPHTGLADLVTLAQHDVGPAYANELVSAGLKVASADELMRLRDHGVTPGFVRSMTTAGYRNVAPEELVRAADHGVTARFVAGLAQRGYAHLSLADLLGLADHGVTTAFIDRLSAHGYKDVQVRDLIRLRDSGV